MQCNLALRPRGSATIGTTPAIPVRFSGAICNSLRHIRASHQSSCRQSFVACTSVQQVVTAIASDTESDVESSSDSESPLKWFERPCLWRTINDLKELEDALRDNTGKYVAVDFFAGWCSSCRGAYPGICKIPRDKALASKITFLKANVENEELAAFVKKQGVIGLPHLDVYHPDGRRLVGMCASFKKVKQVKQSLANIVAHPEAKRFVVDPTGVAQPA